MVKEKWPGRLLSPWLVILAVGVVGVLLEQGFNYVYGESRWLSFALLALVVAIPYAALSKSRGFTHDFWPVLGKAWAITYAVVSVGWHLLHWWSRISDDEDPTVAIVCILLVGTVLAGLATFLWNRLKSKFGVKE